MRPTSTTPRPWATCPIPRLCRLQREEGPRALRADCDGKRPKDSLRARAALFGKARCLEARNELSQAIAQYELVASTWPDTPEAAQAKELAEALKKPEATAFYKELFAYSPPRVTLPPFGNERINMPGSSDTKGAASKGTTSTGPSAAVPPPPVEVTPPGAGDLKPARHRSDSARRFRAGQQARYQNQDAPQSTAISDSHTHCGYAGCGGDATLTQSASKGSNAVTSLRASGWCALGHTPAQTTPAELHD